MNEIIETLGKGLVMACKESYAATIEKGIPDVKKTLTSLEKATKYCEKLLCSVNEQDKDYILLGEMIDYNKRLYLVLSCIVVNMEQTAAINKDLIEKMNGIMEEK